MCETEIDHSSRPPPKPPPRLGWPLVRGRSPDTTTVASMTAAPAKDLAASPFLRACRGEKGDQVPVWFMRQAGRALPEYRAIRGAGTILDAIRQPDLAAEITLQPVRRYGVDAAILYSDIVVPVAAIGFGVDLAPGVGPVVEQPFRSASDLGRLRPFEPELDVPYVLETVRTLVGELGDTPLIGFAGAPFTVASYLVEGRPSRTYANTKALMYGDPKLWGLLLDRMADFAIASLRSQVAAGASVIQLFDSWAGALNRADYERYVLPATRKVLDGVADLDVPRIHFGVGTGELLTLVRDAGADVVGIDWHVLLDDARERLGDDITLQGNLDPAALFAPWDAVAELTRDVLRRAAGHPGHIFNLGHGVPPETDPDVLTRIVELVHEEGRADGSLHDAVAATGTDQPEA
jgi:uroporphyrinogen decarboxylase